MASALSTAPSFLTLNFEKCRMSVATIIESSMQICVLLNLKQVEFDNEDEDERQEEEGQVDEVQLFADEKFDPEFRVSTWEQTILGKLL